jgi:hypothetical protein
MEGVSTRLEGDAYIQYMELVQKFPKQMKNWKEAKVALKFLQDRKDNAQTILAKIQATKMAEGNRFIARTES